MLDLNFESSLFPGEDKVICGIDEAGRGPLCGPVVAGACIIPRGIVIDRLNDSKKLSPAVRDRLFDVITASTVCATAEASVEEIDRLNILEATLLAMRRAVAALPCRPDYLLVDGNVFRGFDIPGRCVIGGDALIPSIAAASVLAKVTRDRMCEELDRRYPAYGIAANKGYGTAAHMEALRRLGPTPVHRRKFIRFLDAADEDDK